MTSQPKPQSVYVGPREAMIAEVAAFDPRQSGISPCECKWLVTPIGDETWDTEWSSNRKEAVAIAREIADHYGVSVSFVH